MSEIDPLDVQEFSFGQEVQDELIIPIESKIVEVEKSDLEIKDSWFTSSANENVSTIDQVINQFNNQNPSNTFQPEIVLNSQGNNNANFSNIPSNLQMERISVEILCESNLIKLPTMPLPPDELNDSKENTCPTVELPVNLPTNIMQLNLPTDPMHQNLPTDPIQLNLPTEPMQLNFTTNPIMFQSQSDLNLTENVIRSQKSNGISDNVKEIFYETSPGLSNGFVYKVENTNPNLSNAIVPEANKTNSNLSNAYVHKVENRNPGTNSFQSSTAVTCQQNDNSGNHEFKIENDTKEIENCSDNSNNLESAQLTNLKNPTEMKKGAYKCFICKNLYGSLETLNHHNCLVNNSKDKVVNETVNKKGFKCTFCPKFCKSMEDLIQHFNDTSGHPRPKNVKRYRKMEDKFECSNCRKLCETLQEFKKHDCVQKSNENMPTVENEFKCKLCLFENDSKDQLTRHHIMSHTKLGEPDYLRIFNCPILDCKNLHEIKISAFGLYHHLTLKHRVDTDKATKLILENLDRVVVKTIRIRSNNQTAQSPNEINDEKLENDSNEVKNENETIECIDCSKVCNSMQEMIQHYNDTPG